MKENKWMKHLATVRAKNPKVKSVSALAKLAKKTYKK